MDSFDETYPKTGYEAQRLRLQGDFRRALHRAPDLAAVPLRQRVSRGRRVR